MWPESEQRSNEHQNQWAESKSQGRKCNSWHKLIFWWAPVKSSVPKTSSEQWSYRRAATSNGSTVTNDRIINCWLINLKYGHFLPSFPCFDSKLNIFGLWTKQNICGRHLGLVETLIGIYFVAVSDILKPKQLIDLSWIITVSCSSSCEFRWNKTKTPLVSHGSSGWTVGSLCANSCKRQFRCNRNGVQDTVNMMLHHRVCVCVYKREQLYVRNVQECVFVHEQVIH